MELIKNNQYLLVFYTCIILSKFQAPPVFKKPKTTGGFGDFSAWWKLGTRAAVAQSEDYGLRGSPVTQSRSFSENKVIPWKSFKISFIFVEIYISNTFPCLKGL